MVARDTTGCLTYCSCRTRGKVQETGYWFSYCSNDSLANTKEKSLFVLFEECVGREGREGGREGGGVVSEPDPRKIEKEGLAHRLGWKCTLRPV